MNNARWETASSTGSREANEDVVAARNGATSSAADHPLAVVCDGIGGHAHGARAAGIAARGFTAAYAAATAAGKPIKEALREALETANRAVRDAIEGDRRLYNMGTTLSAAAITDDGVEWINVGDSPIYLYEARTGTARELGVRHNPPGRRNTLTSALMGEGLPDIAASNEPLPLSPGDVVVIASDGIDTIGGEGVAAACAAKPDIGTTRRAGLDTLPITERSLRAYGPGTARRLLEAVAAAASKGQDNASVATMRATRPLPDRRQGHGATFRGLRTSETTEVWIDTDPLVWERTLAVRNHSPSGPEWGYHGSGPAQLALAMLMEITDAATAVDHYQPFKDEVLANLQTDEWTMGYDEVANWLTAAETGKADAKAAADRGASR